MARTYTDAERVHALAVLEVNAGNLSRTSRETKVPIGTLSLWRNEALSADPERSLKPAETVKTDWVALTSEVFEEASRYLRAELPNMKGRDLAVAYGIASDKFLDHRDGRKATVAVDNRTQSLVLPEGTTLEELKRLRAGLTTDDAHS